MLEILFFAVEVVVADDFEEEVQELDEADPVGEGEQHWGDEKKNILIVWELDIKVGDLFLIF